MEFLGFLVIGFLIAILVLPFVALAKAKRAKRGVDDLARRLSSLENELRNLRPQTVSAVQPEAPMLSRAPKAEAVPSPIPARTAALRDRDPGAIRGDVGMSRLLSLRVLGSHSNVSVNDPDHGSCVSAFRTAERDHRGRAWDRGWISHAYVALNEPGQSARTFRLYRTAGYRSARAGTTATLERAANPGRDWNCADANRLGRRVLCSGEILRRQQGSHFYGGVCCGFVSAPVPYSLVNAHPGSA